METTTACGQCRLPLDPERHAICEVCDGLRLCLGCARSHTCHPSCVAGGCRPGLCTKLVQRGRVADEFGV